MSNYPDSVNPDDPRNPWNDEELREKEYSVCLTVYVIVTATDDEAAAEIAIDRLSGTGLDLEDIQVEEY